MNKQRAEGKIKMEYYAAQERDRGIVVLARNFSKVIK